MPQRDHVLCSLTPEGFFITFGRAAIHVYHLLRWRYFLTDQKWQAAMLSVCASVVRHFNATDCVLAHDDE
jgi:membrane protein implicated in regulation of membrane protease activity